MLYRESDDSPQRKQKSCNKATLIKEKFYNKKKGEKSYNRDVLTHKRPR